MRVKKMISYNYKGDKTLENTNNSYVEVNSKDGYI